MKEAERQTETSQKEIFMTHYEITGLYVALSILVMAALKIATGAARGKAKVSIGDGGDEGLIRAMRAQANAVEDLPVLLLGLIALATLEANTLLLHILGASIVLSRIMHALGMLRLFGPGRMIGTTLSLLALLGAPIALLLKVFA